MNTVAILPQRRGSSISTPRRRDAGTPRQIILINVRRKFDSCEAGADQNSQWFWDSRCFRKTTMVVFYGAHLAVRHPMPEKSLEARVSAIEAQLAGKTLEEHFREQAELIDRRFDDSFRTQAELIDKLFAYRFEQLDRTWGPRLGTLEQDVSALKRDMVIVREGIAILLKRS
jgi:hypothetical protein